jgi:hypothetical protein
MSLTTILIIILIIYLLGGFAGTWPSGGPYVGGGLGLVLLILIILVLLGRV